MEIRQYIRLMGRLYVQGAVSNFHPRLLRRFGGSLAIAARDAEVIRTQPGILGLRRDYFDATRTARAKWRRHVAAIGETMRAGNSPSRSVYLYCRKYNTYPHDDLQLELGVRRTTSGFAWQQNTLRTRERIRQGSGVMSNTFGAVTTMVALAITAENWQRATPDEWDTALNVGQVGVLLGDVAGAHRSARNRRTENMREAIPQ